MSEYIMTCPRCGGEIRIASIRCKNCGHPDMDKPPVTPTEEIVSENERPKDVKWFIRSTVITVVFTSISGFLSITVYQLEKNVVSELALILLIPIPFLVLSTWKQYREGNIQLAAKLRNAMLVISIIPLVGMLFISCSLLLFFLGPY